MDLGVSGKLAPLLAEVKAFIAEEVVPVEEEYHREIGTGDRAQVRHTRIDDVRSPFGRQVGEATGSCVALGGLVDESAGARVAFGRSIDQPLRSNGTQASVH